jgi:hypothetical protein
VAVGNILFRKVIPYPLPCRIAQPNHLTLNRLPTAIRYFEIGYRQKGRRESL